MMDRAVNKATGLNSINYAKSQIIIIELKLLHCIIETQVEIHLSQDGSPFFKSQSCGCECRSNNCIRSHTATLKKAQNV